ncbi:phosphoadenosine phosphosulfate reductase domain-containing protein [Thermomonospora cellulosilytica]|uniref:3'-phosphoadenosine 5'-phosphosulfate sulfotransferase (PAPS reductase)/FAD synthetase n=1 Tax=Thermomonospora cellulosilytica TaxID=1411118 RepID=A0A7W3RAK7_9ACTN|nr:phosphoadenosine phosphosulfate reductase family protein [Thermomonospora cellulosilytica]MBA9005972.1 3'-phosphoadenosine 5'-phosphosulfate sulfotransferase (PAPS reductase)/FAD synthetase [Thermomonospora cellulosilytica]
MAIPRKQTLPDSETWRRARAQARAEWPDERLDQLIDQTVEAIRAQTRGKRAAYAWSGGKDSIALGHVAELAGVEDCCLAISNLEFPAFLTWVTDHMPGGLTVINTGQDLAWLAQHPEMLFPQGSYGTRWFSIVNHRGQARYYRQNNLDLLLLGRRTADGNYTGPKGQHIYTNKEGITRYSPLAAWPHEAVFALIDREQLPMPPCYDWPRGYQVGTGSWPARQWTRDRDHGFEEVWEIDPDVIRAAAPDLPAAADWMRRTGRQ